MGTYDKIREKADEKKIAIIELERRANLGIGSIGKWNAVSPTARSVKAVADVLECTVDELIGD